jgi:hypothetical protein
MFLKWENFKDANSIVYVLNLKFNFLIWLYRMFISIKKDKKTQINLFLFTKIS